MNSCHCEFYILQFRCLIVLFISYSFLEGLSILFCQATAVWNYRGLGSRRWEECEVPTSKKITKEQAPGQCCMKSGLEKFFARLVQSPLVLVRREERESRKIWFERRKNCDDS